MAVSSTYAYIPYLYIELNSWQGKRFLKKVMILVSIMIYLQVFMSQTVGILRIMGIKVNSIFNNRSEYHLQRENHINV